MLCILCRMHPSYLDWSSSRVVLVVYEARELPMDEAAISILRRPFLGEYSHLPNCPHLLDTFLL